MTMFGKNCPYERAVADFECALSVARLKATPADEIALAATRRPRRSASNLSTVYVIGNNANSLLKIGYADNLMSRFSGLNCGSPVDLAICHFIHVVDGAIAKRIEGEIHKVLADRRRKGEWFEVSVAEAGEAMAKVVLANRLRWWTEEESRRLVISARESFARYQEKQRFYGT